MAEPSGTNDYSKVIAVTIDDLTGADDGSPKG